MSRFADYLQKTFHFSPSEAEEIIQCMKKPLKKSIRVNTRKISLSDFKLHATEQGWTLTETEIPEVFLIDRDDTTIALGKTLEHTAGWFYIQEVAAAMPPFLLKQEREKREKRKEKREGLGKDSQLFTLHSSFGTILDMCAAPGGKTTQLADYFPDSLIIANEVNRTRTPQLFDNLDRMGYDNIAVVSCDGRFFQNFPEFFDAVLLDAPCSGEGTAFRDGSVIDHWNEKNIVNIAKLQKQLFETAETVVRPGGFVSYSTCTLNKEENEEVITLNVKHGTLKALFEKRFWPHIEKTGGFFASIFRKALTPNPSPEGRGETDQIRYPILAAEGQKNLIVKPATKGEKEIVERFVAKHFKTNLKKGFLFLSKGGVYLNSTNLGPLAEHFFFVHAGARIGSIKGNIFTPTHHLAWYVEDTHHIPQLEISPIQWTDIQLGKKVKFDHEDGCYLGKYGRGVMGIIQIYHSRLSFD